MLFDHGKGHVLVDEDWTAASRSHPLPLARPLGETHHHHHFNPHPPAHDHCHAHITLFDPPHECLVAQVARKIFSQHRSIENSVENQHFCGEIFFPCWPTEHSHTTTIENIRVLNLLLHSHTLLLRSLTILHVILTRACVLIYILSDWSTMHGSEYCKFMRILYIRGLYMYCIQVAYVHVG